MTIYWSTARFLALYCENCRSFPHCHTLFSYRVLYTDDEPTATVKFSSVMCLDFYNSFEDVATIYQKRCRKTQLVLVMKSIDIMQIHVQMCFTVQLR